jgi:Alternative oxidase
VFDQIKLSLQIHFAEEWNELHHLQIMEALGGDQLWVDRFFAQHAAIVYYWVLIVFFLVSPSLSYGFSELIEVRHSSVKDQLSQGLRAYDTNGGGGVIQHVCRQV